MISEHVVNLKALRIQMILPYNPYGSHFDRTIGRASATRYLIKKKYQWDRNIRNKILKYLGLIEEKKFI